MGEEEEKADEADLIEYTEETTEESPGLFQWPWQGYQPWVHFAEAANIMNQMEYMEVVTLGLTKGCIFLVTIAGTPCNSLTDTRTSHSCMSEIFIKTHFLKLKKVFILL